MERCHGRKQALALVLSCLVCCVSILMKCEEHQWNVRCADLQGREEFTVDQGGLPESHPRSHVTRHPEVRILSSQIKSSQVKTRKIKSSKCSTVQYSTIRAGKFVGYFTSSHRHRGDLLLCICLQLMTSSNYHSTYNVIFSLLRLQSSVIKILL